MTSVLGRVTEVTPDGRVAVRTPGTPSRPAMMDKGAAIAAIGLAFAEAWRVRTAGGRPIPETIYHDLAGRGILLVQAESVPDGE